MSKSGPSVWATLLVSPASRLTPRLILPALTIAAWRAAASILAWSLGGEPGRADDVDDARLRGEAGKGHGRLRRGEIEHAMHLGEDRQRIVGDGDAEGPEPAISPRSWPIAGEPLASMPAASTQPGVAATARASVCPIRPAAPSTASFMSDMAKGPSLGPRGLTRLDLLGRGSSAHKSWIGTLGVSNWLRSAPGEGHFAQGDVAEPLGAFSDRLAAEAEIEGAGAVIVGRGPRP